MRSLSRVLLLAAACVAVALWVRLPAAPLAVRLDEAESLRRRTEWRGAYHIHSNRSDGTGTIDEIARAAADAGLDFIIVTDHGDATQTLDPPSYRFAVLVIDAVEISSSGGHYVALGLDGPAPYRIGGAPAEVVDDVRWLGGFGFAAHPDSPRRSLSWRDRSARVDGVEWFNADSAWRDESRLDMAFGLLTYPFRPGSTVAGLFDRPVEALGWWDAAAAGGRHLRTLAALDAHARLGMRGTDEDEVRGGVAIEAPSYRKMFSVATNRVWLRGTPTGNAHHDAAMLLEAIEAGHSYSVIDAFAHPGFLRATMTATGRRVQFGDRLAPGERLDIRVETDGPAGAEIRLLHNGQVTARSRAPVLMFSEVATAGAYRVEVHVPASRDRREGMPWMVTNSLFAWPAGSVAPSPTAADEEAVSVDLSGCRPEADVDSRVAWDPSPGVGGYTLTYALARSTAPFAAVACPLPVPAGDLTGVSVESSATPVMRVKVQVRAPSAERDLRWGSSVRLEPSPTTQSASWKAFVPVGSEAAAATPTDANNLLLVIDRQHAASGAQGVVSIRRLAVTRRGSRPGSAISP